MTSVFILPNSKLAQPGKAEGPCREMSSPSEETGVKPGLRWTSPRWFAQPPPAARAQLKNWPPAPAPARPPNAHHTHQAKVTPPAIQHSTTRRSLADASDTLAHASRIEFALRRTTRGKQNRQRSGLAVLPTWRLAHGPRSLSARRLRTPLAITRHPRPSTSPSAPPYASTLSSASSSAKPKQTLTNCAMLRTRTGRQISMRVSSGVCGPSRSGLTGRS